MQGRGRGDLLHQIEITAQGVAFSREARGERFDEGLAPLRQPEAFTAEGDLLVPRRIERTQLQVVPNPEVVQQLPKHLTLVAAADEVHAGFELRLAAPEALQTAADPGILLQQGHLVPVPGQYDAARQPAKAASDNHATPFHNTLTFMTPSPEPLSGLPLRPSESR